MVPRFGFFNGKLNRNNFSARHTGAFVGLCVCSAAPVDHRPHATDLRSCIPMDRVNGAFGQFRSLLGIDTDHDLALEHEQDLSFMDEFNRSCSLSRTQRLYGFVACLLLGFFCSILSVLVFLHPAKFAITFTFGNLLSLGSTCFLIGPMQQLKMMCDPVRVVATVVYLCSIVFALISALYLRVLIFTLFAVIVEVFALIWYSLSYIPFARETAKRCFTRCLEAEV